MTKRLFWCILTLLMPALSAYSQNNFLHGYKLSNQTPKGMSGFPLKMNSGFGLLNSDLNTLYLFSEVAEFIDSINFFVPSSNEPLLTSNRFLFELKEHYVLLNRSWTSMLFFDKKGHLSQKVKMKLKSKNCSFNVDYRALGITNGFFHQSSQSFFIPIQATLKKGGKESFLNHDKRKDKECGYIGEISIDGKLINVYGKGFDSIYNSGGFSHTDSPLMDMFDNDIALSMNLSHKIHIQKIGAQDVETFGEKGKSIEKAPDELPKILSRDESFLYETSRLIESYFYWSLDVTENYIFRTYTKSIIDTVPADPEDIAFIQKYLDGEILGCTPTTRTEKLQKELLRKKPFFIQIYSKENKELLFDEPISFSYPYFVGYKNNTAYFLNWDMEERRYNVHSLDLTHLDNMK